MNKFLELIEQYNIKVMIDYRPGSGWEISMISHNLGMNYLKNELKGFDDLIEVSVLRIEEEIKRGEKRKHEIINADRENLANTILEVLENKHIDDLIRKMNDDLEG